MLRAFIFFTAFMGAIVLPQLVAHGLNYLYPPQPKLGEDEDALRATPAGFSDPSLVFGPGVRREFVQDGRAVYPQVLAGAEVAQLGLTGTGASVLAARFVDADAARRARYALVTILGKVNAEEDDNGLFRFTWPQSGHAAIAGNVGRTLMMWVAADRDSVERLLAVRFLESPITIGPGRADDQLVVDWKYADAKWADHARAHGMRKTHRLILELDEATRTVRCREFHTESGWDAGMAGASIRWKTSWEIVFFQYEHERVYGLRVGPDGKLAPSLSHAYTFNLREMKDPVIAAITAAGWNWRQVFFFSPPWLRWLHG